MSARRTKKTLAVEHPDIRPEYDFSAGVPGKYAARFARGSNVVVLEPDVAAKFRTSRAVNEVLRKHVAPTRRRKTGGA